MEWVDFSRIFSEKIQNLQKCIVPLYKMNEFQGKPEFVGSSIFCSFENIKLLITAKHVFDEIIPYRPWFPNCENELREFQFEKYIIIDDEDLDFGIIEIENDMDLYNPIKFSDFAQFEDSIEFQHLLVGYPSSYTKKSSPRLQKLKFQGYLTSSAEEAEYERLEIDKKKKFIVSFKKKNVFDENHIKITFPDPNGMSGGAVFQFNEKNHNDLKLVGIMTDWDTNRQKAIIATRAELIYDLFKLKKITIYDQDT